jgi:hypothetical protein
VRGVVVALNLADDVRVSQEGRTAAGGSIGQEKKSECMQFKE